MRSLVLSLTMLVALAACTHNSRTDAIHAALVTVDVARDEFALADDGAQHRIVDVSTSAADAKSRLADYRAQRDKGPAAALTLAYRAIAVAAAANDAKSLGDLQAALAALVAALKEPLMSIGANL